MPLVLPIHLTCNVPDELIYGNIRVNSRRPNSWLTSAKAHERIAVLCGSGPSLRDHISDIRKWQDDGTTIFALNGAARFLPTYGIIPDYQVLIDARQETANLIGPARVHLFASQCHPECFERIPQAILWHLQVENIDDYLPDEQPEHVLIGGAASVGNTALCAVYAMGYRTMHLYGYDSSNRGDATHAFSQPMNAGDPMASVAFNGKDYICSLTMKLQAERFCSLTAPAIRSLGCKLEVNGTGLLPDMYHAPRDILDQYDSDAKATIDDIERRLKELK